MGAAYDSYDYSAYWEGRDYEHNSEVVALKKILQKIPKIGTIIDIGAGFGRLTPVYAFRGKKVIIAEPSAKLLSLARKNLTNYQNLEFVQASVEILSEKVPRGRADLVLMVRVAHHLQNLESAFRAVNSLLKPGGFFVLEFANKLHFKAIFKELLRGNINYSSELSPKDVRSPKSIRNHTISFLNHHPKNVDLILEKTGFKVLDKLSVSNFRNRILKKYLPMELLTSLESAFQKPLSYINFGPSIFVLAQKKS